MNDSSSGLVILFAVLFAVGVAALLLYWRDRVAKSQGKTPRQVQARFSALLQFRAALQRCIPGVLIMVLGIFFALDRLSERESDWWQGLLFIPVGWVLVPLLARKSWRRYRELQRVADQDEHQSIPLGPSTPGTPP